MEFHQGPRAERSSEEESAALGKLGSVETVMGEMEAGLEMARHLLRRLGAGAIESEAAVLDLRRSRGYRPGESSTRLVEVRIPDESRAQGKPLAALGLPDGALIVLLSRGGEFIVPRGTTVLRSADVLLALADEEALSTIRQAVAPASLPSPG